MARRWTLEEEKMYRDELIELYVTKNKSLKEVSESLQISQKTVFRRLRRLDISSTPELKLGYLHKNIQIVIPDTRTEKLAEFFGIMLGDGHISKFQTIVTLGTKEIPYVHYVAELMKDLFSAEPHITTRMSGYRDVYVGSTELVHWLESEGLVQHKVAAQVNAPLWIFDTPEFMKAFLRGFFDTDGSLYKLRFGLQISLTNKACLC